jgi:hypothetical protein
MEACATAHYWARELSSSNHTRGHRQTLPAGGSKSAAARSGRRPGHAHMQQPPFLCDWKEGGGRPLVAFAYATRAEAIAAATQMRLVIEHAVDVRPYHD